MSVVQKINSLGPQDRFISFEFFPPKTDTGFRNLLARLHRMSALNPLFITVTWGAGGSTSEKSLDLAITCQKELGLTTVLHLTCTNTNKDIIDNALQRAKENGIRNILALRGDPPRTEEYWTPDCDFYSAVDLVKYIKQQHGDYFCIGVAGYPEGHVEGSDTSNQNPEKDIPYLEEKIDAGAEFIITQLFYDVDKFMHYQKLLSSSPKLKNIPLIPGLMPITTYKVFTRASKLSHSSIPHEIESQLQNTSSDDNAVKSIGIRIITDMVDQINNRSNGAIRGYHFYCLNLEKAVASVLDQSAVLRPIMEAPTNTISHDDAVASDDEDIEMPPKKGRRRSSIINENEVAAPGFAAVGMGHKASANKALLSDKRTLVDISTGKGALGKDATWDDFPNGRFGDSNSPAYGEIDGYGPSLKIHSPQEAIAKWGTPESTKDISKVFLNYLSGKINILPWVDAPLSAETALIQEELFELNDKGWFSLASQPSVNGARSSDKIFGWGPSNGFVFQKSFVEIFIPKEEWSTKLYPKLKHMIDNLDITYYAGDSSGKIQSNLPVGPDSHNSKNAVTWGVFPSQEVLQPTIIDIESFRAWNEEAFHLWSEWARCYKKNSVSYNLLNSINGDYYLVSLIYHNFNDETGLWRALLE
ncbi:hypothetical protein PGUG_01501 [Meyerozyma guilliermondii ATCC 6260]|uniref:MTHFR SAM-binding regulatory domain-containing protein n=1 Tax=Meyerozyma guilliermondii (strain ATCC 6260 / CBS 566 / DSM 6381 / JCM 1539 / NBRC 10279 / NRRL Y-324) TaxID=294746 RepID=A5DE00_PICGU|nr:uncharacterized protein PGUG_01501 [Meyerozyma guilliermondii ATCC 6260]EDK37403.2 hypothetical protein PGUG_01501 [Meyerozyma guilliermondii ATCC 6260]